MQLNSGLVGSYYCGDRGLTDLAVLDVYKVADDHNVIVVGGAANSVGAAGGWVQGGGHSLLGGLYGVGVDSRCLFTRQDISQIIYRYL